MLITHLWAISWSMKNRLLQLGIYHPLTTPPWPPPPRINSHKQNKISHEKESKVFLNASWTLEYQRSFWTYDKSCGLLLWNGPTNRITRSYWGLQAFPKADPPLRSLSAVHLCPVHQRLGHTGFKVHLTEQLWTFLSPIWILPWPQNWHVQVNLGHHFWKTVIDCVSRSLWRV